MPVGSAAARLISAQIAAEHELCCFYFSQFRIKTCDNYGFLSGANPLSLQLALAALLTGSVSKLRFFIRLT